MTSDDVSLPYLAYGSNLNPEQMAASYDVTELSTGNGYTSGGTDIQNDYSESGGTGMLTAVDVVFTASGGSVGPFRYAIIYNDTPTSPADPLVCYFDYGSSISLNDGETLTVDFGASLLTIS